MLSDCPKRRQRTAAFTLIEVMLTTVVVTTSLVMVFRGLSVCMHAAKRSERYTTAAMLVQRKIAELEIEDTIEARTEEGDFQEEGYPDFRWRVEIRDAEDVDTLGLYEATITVSWPVGESEREIRIVRLFAERTEEDQA